MRISGKSVIEDAMFKYIRCPNLVASGSIIPEMVEDTALQTALSTRTESIKTRAVLNAVKTIL